jgi:hypothetical protein
MKRSRAGAFLSGIFSFTAIVSLGARATAQTQADITPHLIAQGLDPDDLPSAYVKVVSKSPGFDPSSPDAELHCVPPNVPVKLLEFQLYTYNDGYADFVVNNSTVTAIPSAFYTLPGFDLPLVTNFGAFTLVNVATHAVATGIDENGQPFPVTAKKELFSLASDYPISYRPDAPIQPPTGFPNPTDAWEFVVRGWLDDYDIDASPCQYVRIDGVPDGDYDLVIDDDAARLLVCDSTNDANCPFDGRVYDNVLSVRVNLTTTNGVTAATLETPLVVAGSVTPIGPSDVTGPPGVTGPPAVVTHNVDTYDLFFVGTNGALYTVAQATNGVWPQGSAGSPLYAASPALAGGAIAAVASDRVRTDVFGRATTGDVLRISNAGTGYVASTYGAAALGLGAVGRPAAVASGPKSALVAWMTPQGSVAYGLFNGTSWQTVQTLPGTYPSAQTPAVASSGDGMFHLFVRDAAGAVWYTQYFAGSWGTWTSLGGAVTGDLSAASPYLNCVDVFATTADHRLLRNTWSGAGSPTTPPNAYAACGCSAQSTFCGWRDDIASASCYWGVGVACSKFDASVGSASTVISAGPQKLDAFFYDISKPDMLWQLHYDGTVVPAAPGLAPQPWTLSNLGQISVVQPMWPIVAGSWADGTFDVFQKFQSGQISTRSMR